MVHIESENLRADLTGWRTDTGFLLDRPIKSSVHFTPELAQWVSPSQLLETPERVTDHIDLKCCMPQHSK